MTIDPQYMSEQISPCVLDYARGKMTWLRSKCYPNFIIVYMITAPIISIPILVAGLIKCKLNR